MKLNLLIISVLLLAVILTNKIYTQPTDIQSSWAYDILNIPQFTEKHKSIKPVIIAVVDDGFRLSHNELKDFIYRNPDEVPGNQLDDDGNDYIDDVGGWDVSDEDADVSVAVGKEYELFHGTYIASIITGIAKLRYGGKASDYIKIMPVKAISDFAQLTYIKDGYKGIKYALDNGASIICLAWSGGTPGTEEKKILAEAKKKKVLIIASAGNFWQEQVLEPAAEPEVMAVAAVDSSLDKYEKSNYGMKIEISAPGKNVKGAHPEKDNAYIFEQGTSPAAAIVAAAAGILLAEKPSLSSEEIKDALINSSTPFPEQFETYGGKMGSGIINIGDALRYIGNSNNAEQLFSPLRPKGKIAINSKSKKPEYSVTPAGSYHGFYLHLSSANISKSNKQILEFYVNDTIWNSYSITKLPDKLFIPHKSFKLKLSGKKLSGKQFINIEYSCKTIDSTTLYCHDTKYYTVDKQTIEDGSGDSDYANNCSCKWIIRAPAGKRVKFVFDKMDTQGNVDFVYLVDGETAIPSEFIAKFSGQNLPPIVFSKTNTVLIWFVTDKYITGKGWQFHYEFID